MIKQIFVLATMLISTFSCAQKEATTFEKEGLESEMLNVEKQRIKFSEILLTVIFCA